MAEYTVELDSGTVEEGGDHRLVDRLRDLRSGGPDATVDSVIDRRDEVEREAFTYRFDDADVLVGIPEAYRTRRDGVGGLDRHSRFDDHGNVDLVVPAGGDAVDDPAFVADLEAVVDSTDAPHVLPATRGDEWGRYEKVLADRGIEAVELDAGDRLHVDDATITQLDGDGATVLDVEQAGHHTLVAPGTRWLDAAVDETYERVHGEAYEPDTLAVGNPTPAVDDRHDGSLRVRGDDVIVADAVPDDHARHEARLRVLADGATSVAVGQPLDETALDLFGAAGVEAVAGPRTSTGVGVGDPDGESPEALLAERAGKSADGNGLVN